MQKSHSTEFLKTTNRNVKRREKNEGNPRWRKDITHEVKIVGGTKRYSKSNELIVLVLLYNVHHIASYLKRKKSSCFPNDGTNTNALTRIYA